VKYFNFSSQDEVRRMIYPICTTSHKGLTFEGFVIKLTERLREYYENINPDLVRKICLDKGNNPIIEKNALEVLKYFKGREYGPDLVLDAGDLKPAAPSQVIDFTGPEPKVLRK